MRSVDITERAKAEALTLAVKYKQKALFDQLSGAPQVVVNRNLQESERLKDLALEMPRLIDEYQNL